MKYKISEEFTDAPGGRFRRLGKHSGEEFRDDILINILNDLKDGEKLILDLWLSAIFFRRGFWRFS